MVEQAKKRVPFCLTPANLVQAADAGRWPLQVVMACIAGAVLCTDAEEFASYPEIETAADRLLRGEIVVLIHGEFGPDWSLPEGEIRPVKPGEVDVPPKADYDRVRPLVRDVVSKWVASDGEGETRH